MDRIIDYRCRIEMLIQTDTRMIKKRSDWNPNRRINRFGEGGTK